MLINNDKETQQELRDQLEHQTAVVALQSIIASKDGRKVFKYLFKSLGVNELPEIGLEGDIMHQLLGHYRAGQSVFKMACEANHNIAGQLIAEIEKEKRDYETLPDDE